MDILYEILMGNPQDLLVVILGCSAGAYMSWYIMDLFVNSKGV